MSATTTDLWRMSATDLATAIRSRQASSQEVIESHLRRIEAVNPSINARQHASGRSDHAPLVCGISVLKPRLAASRIRTPSSQWMRRSAYS